MNKSRRKFIINSGIYTGSIMVGSHLVLSSCNGKSKNMSNELDVASDGNNPKPSDFLKFSLAQWSFNKALFGGELNHLDFAAKAKSLGFEGIEYVNQFFKDKATDQSFLQEMNKRAKDQGIQQLLIMIDGEGGLGQTSKNDLDQAIENHKKWIEAAKTLGCHSIRVNAYGLGSAEDVSNAAIDGLGRLSLFAKDFDINVIVENHGGYSSNGKWLANVMTKVNMSNCGTLPDFGNFCIASDNDNNCTEEYDKYLGVKELMPFAKGVSAKSMEFDDDGNETTIDFEMMMKTVVDSGYKGFVGVEFEGGRMSEEEGVIATRGLLKKVIAKLG